MEGCKSGETQEKVEDLYNISSSFLLLGIVEMERLNYLYCALSLLAYLFILLCSTIIILVVLQEESLHEPMYTLIANLVLNGIFGSSTFFPKLTVDLLLSYKEISRAGCLIQSFCVLFFGYCEISLFAIMAYDTYWAVCHPLHYAAIMTNRKILRLVLASLFMNCLLVGTAVLLSARLPLCGVHIKSVFCDNTALFVLSCVDTSVNKIFGTINFTCFLSVHLLLIAYCYVRIFLTCLKVSENAGRKAAHTLVTHLLNFSIFLVATLFIFIRYRLGDINIPVIVHVILSASGLIFPPLLNPLIYGVRTKALKVKVLCYLQRTNILVYN
ncbi:olfactory receptor 1M1 [Xenopus tropicalis]|uniref:Olfactory receptor 1M1 n=1 Tax=Xenopus tropicalis TaxID=8364 RepID=A0A8J0QY37_XENTR|nr:olfactory receptor 1M1 [Xenopus tropicalis]